MTTVEAQPQVAETRPVAAARLTSLDAFRGLVILTMTLVNYLAHVDNIPAWAKHMPEKMEGYTLADVVFPGFLFIVGVAIPLALHKRMARGESAWSLLKRVLARTASLLFVGVIIVNTSAFSAEAAAINKNLWFLLAMLAVVVLWTMYPAEASKERRRLYLDLRIFAGVVLAALLVVFRGENNAGQVVWLQHSWWGILGLIGWAYLVCCLAYLACRGSAVALMGALGFLIALYIGDKHGVLDWRWLGPVHNFVGIGPVLGSTAASVMIGVLVGNCFVGQNASLSAAATDSYTLVTGAICCWSFVAVYLLMDVLRVRRWASVLVSIGENALLAYILPGIIRDLFAVVGLGTVLWQYGSGWAGALNAGVLTFLILFLTWGATRSGLRLKL